MVQIPQGPWGRKHYRFGLAGEGQADVIEQLLHARRGTVLDIGCGHQGVHAANLKKCSKLLVAADKDEGMIRSARSDLSLPTNIIFLAADAYDLPLASESVDHVVALGLLAYITDLERLFLEFHRVIRKRGMVMISNSVSRDKNPVVHAAFLSGLRLVCEREGKCPAATGPTKRRYLCVFERA